MHQTVNSFKIQELLTSAISYIKRRLLFIVLLFLFTSISIIVVYNIFETVPYYIELMNNSGKIFKLNDEYFYCTGNKIINCNNIVLYVGNEEVIAAASDKFIYVLDGMKIYKITFEGIIVTEKNIETSTLISLENCNPQIYYFDSLIYLSIDNHIDKMFIFDENLNPIDIHELKLNSSHYEINRTHYYIIENDDSFLTIAEYDDRSSFMALTDKVDGKEIFSTGLTISVYDNYLFLYYGNSRHDKFNLITKTVISSFENTNEVCFFSEKIYKDHVISLGMETNRGDIEYSNHLSDHYKDILEITDTNGTLIVKHETRKHERIIFFDNEKAVTYYNGKYRFYDLNDWRCYRTINAKNISSNGTYSYESCGDYIFVFDSSNNLIDRISIDEDV